jgi:hypothetical protein
MACTETNVFIPPGDQLNSYYRKVIYRISKNAEESVFAVTLGTNRSTE